MTFSEGVLILFLGQLGNVNVPLGQNVEYILNKAGLILANIEAFFGGDDLNSGSGLGSG
jgi:hypothetical protein